MTRNRGEEQATTAPGEEKSFGRAVVILASVIVILAVAGFLLIARMVESNKARELDAAYRQMGLVADSRAAAVNDWLAAQKDAMAAVARNATVSFFMTELAWAGDLARVTDGEARLQILENYLLFSAEQGGFAAPPKGADIPANIERKARAGMAILNPDGAVVAATPWTPRLGDRLGDFKTLAGAGGATLIGPFPGEAGEATIAVVAPIGAFEGGAATGDGAVGYVLGVRLVGDALDERLAQPGEQTETGKSYLVTRDADGLRYVAGADDAPLSPLAGDPETLAAAFAVAAPGRYGIRRDYADREVLATGRKLDEAPWVLVRTVTAKEALGDAESRARTILAVFALALLCLVAGVLLIWRHGASVRVAAAAARQARLAARLERLTAFLRTVTDSQPTAIAAVDGEGHYRFANRRAAADAGMAPRDMIGKTVAAALGSGRARGLVDDNRRALDIGAAVTRVRSLDTGAGEQILNAHHIPIDIPAGIGGDESAEHDGGAVDETGVLMVLEDVTQLVTERERREHTLRQLVTTLATIIDGRDPFAARHSGMVAEVSEAIAADMGLDDVLVETAEIAGALMNLGKLMVPREVLTRSGDLAPDELETIRASILKSAELLKGVAFDGPVVETIRQVQARFDGTGIPAGLAGEDILVTARVVAVANAFVGMISARAYREALPMDEVIRLLLKGVGTAFDRRPVAALVNYLDNHGGRERWENAIAAPSS